nr:MAG TPA: hypothetical protein [Caudoviricetes sp.]
MYSCFGWLLLRCALTANLTVHLPRGFIVCLRLCISIRTTLDSAFIQACH